MKTAISVRCEDLIAAAQRLQAIIDAEQHNAPLPTFALCRAAVCIDDAVNKLESHAAKLQTSAGLAAGDDTTVVSQLPWSSAVDH